MFTGIIEELGTISSLVRFPHSMKMTLESPFLSKGLKIGESLAVNGVCLTAVDIKRKNVTVDIVEETIARTNLGRKKVGEKMNLERALSLSGRLNGHIVNGHVDGLGIIKSKNNMGNFYEIAFEVPPLLSNYLVEKASIALDGISLTIASIKNNLFTVAVIPHTLENTTLNFTPVNTPVNVEIDILSKYVQRHVLRTEAFPPVGRLPAIDIDLSHIFNLGNGLN